MVDLDGFLSRLFIRDSSRLLHMIEPSYSVRVLVGRALQGDSAIAEPDQSFGPAQSRRQPLHGREFQQVFLETRIDRHLFGVELNVTYPGYIGAVGVSRNVVHSPAYFQSSGCLLRFLRSFCVPLRELLSEIWRPSPLVLACY